jgi:hypothetical protein
MSRKTKQPSINHINLLNAIKARSGVEVCHASNETLAKDLGVSLSTVKRLLDDMQRPVEERTPPSKERKRVPLGLGSIEIITGRPFHQGGKMHQHREIYIIDRTSCDEKGAYMVAALAAKFGRTTKREDRYFCGQLQCTKGQFERWLELAQELDLVSVSVDETDGRRVITRIAKGVSEEVELPDTLRVAAPVEVDGKWKLVSSKSDWTPHLKRSIAERLRDLLRSQCAQQGACVLTNAQLAGHVGAPERTTKRALAELVAAGEFHAHRRSPGSGWGRILSDRKLSDAEVAEFVTARRRGPAAVPKEFPDLPEPASREKLLEALRLRIESEWPDYLPAVKITITDEHIEDALGNVLPFEVSGWARDQAQRILSPHFKAYFEEEERRRASDPAILLDEFVSAVRHYVSLLNQAWNPPLTIEPAEVARRANGLRVDNLYDLAREVAEELHLAHRLEGKVASDAVQPAPVDWVEPSVKEVRGILSDDWQRVAVGIEPTVPPFIDSYIADIIERARQGGATGWVAYLAADLVIADEPRRHRMLALREKYLRKLAAANRSSNISVEPTEAHAAAS